MWLPSGAPYPSGDTFPTRWITGYDLKGRTLFFQPQFRPFLMWLERGHLATETRPLRLDLRGAHLQGDVIPDLGVATAVPD